MESGRDFLLRAYGAVASCVIDAVEGPGRGLGVRRSR
jgi:hypothetical protein